MRILVLGSSGFLGSAIINILKKKFQIFNNGLKKRKYDLSKKNSVEKLINKSKPHVIINCAAVADIEYAEKNKKKTKLINAELVKWIQNHNKKLKKKFWFIHFSTDSLYFKNKKNAEVDKIKALNYYSKTKLLAENYCNANSLIFRTNFFGKSNLKQNSFSDFVYKSFKSNKEFYLINNIFFNPLRVNTIAIILKKILEKKEIYYGIYNLGSRGLLSKYNFAIFFAKKAGIYKPNCYKIVNSKKIFLIKRSNFMAMSVKKFEKKFRYKLPHINKEILDEVKKNYEKI